MNNYNLNNNKDNMKIKKMKNNYFLTNVYDKK